MRISFFICIITFSFISNSCKKQDLSSSHRLVGKWRINNYDYIYKCVSPANLGLYYSTPVKKGEMEIFSSGKMIFSFEGKTEKMQLSHIEHVDLNVEFHSFEDVIEEYICKVRNKKGQVFTFRFYLGAQNTEIVGTYWTPNHLYHTLDQPNYAALKCSWGSTNSSYSDEYFVKYVKI